MNGETAAPAAGAAGVVGAAASPREAARLASRKRMSGVAAAVASLPAALCSQINMQVGLLKSLLHSCKFMPAEFVVSGLN